jgi:hypothetical protein
MAVTLVPSPWEVELARVAAHLEAKTKQARWTDRTDVLIEREFVVGAYAMRTLVASHSESEQARFHRIPVRRFDSGVDDLELSRRGTLTVADLCHHILNNTVFSFYCGETDDLFDGIYLSSDPGEDDVFLVLASDFIALCNDIVTENV